MPVIDKITIQGFKSLRSIEGLELRPINVLIGANGSGKSNLLEALEFLQAVSQGPAAIDAYVGRAGGANRLLHGGAKHTGRMFFEVRDSEGYGVKTALEPTAADGLRVSSDWLIAAHHAEEYENPGLEALGRKGIKRSELDYWRTYHFHDTGRHSPLRQTGDLHDNRFLRGDGSNLAAYLYRLRERHSLRYGMITGIIKLTAPFFDDFILEPSKLNPDKIRLEWRQTGSDNYFDAAALSDGLLRFIALVTLLYQPPELVPPVVLLDEPELGLHPHAITLLAALVRSLTATKEKQVILATNSSELLDHFDEGYVLVADRFQGATELTRMDPPKWMDDCLLSEIWGRNYVGGRPDNEWRPYR